MAAAPNFAYDLCVRRLADRPLTGLDLSSWRLAANGAEPISPDTLERFADIVSREVTGEGFTYRDTYAESLTRVGQALASAADREASDRGLS